MLLLVSISLIAIDPGSHSATRHSLVATDATNLINAKFKSVTYL